MSHSRSRTPDRRWHWRRGIAGTAALVSLAGAVLTACQTDDASPSSGSATAAAGEGPAKEAVKVAPVRLASSISPGADEVPIDRPFTIRAHHGSLKSVKVSSAAGERLAGALSADRQKWSATGRMEPGTTYVVRIVAERSDGKRVTKVSRFQTEALTLDEQTYPSVAPLNGETVGVGMPVIVTFDVPVTDKKTFEKHMTVTSKPAQPGSWHWLSDYEAHWRPKSYWKAGTDVHVDVDVNSVPAGNGIYGQENRSVDFHIGDAHIYKVNTQTDQMRVFSNGKLLRTIPITTGKPGFTTRSGVKVIIEKFPVKRMRSETIGIGKNNPEYYDIDDVRWAMRVTYSGEFIHAAPWSVAYQGHDNVSHGCTGMSTANAAWLYSMTRRGDVAEYTGTDRPMEFTNGYGDWNESFANYRDGSALS